jgi:hypothetical protein
LFQGFYDCCCPSAIAAISNQERIQPRVVEPAGG